MNLKSIGDRKIVERIVNMLNEDGAVHNEDCAVINFKNRILLFSTDIVMENTHFYPESTPEKIGSFTASINLSDIAACGGIPQNFLLALSVPSEMEFDTLQRIFKGLKNKLVEFNCSIIGGDIKSSSCITLTGFITGYCKGKNALLRNMVRIGDLVAVTGYCGRAGYGYHLATKFNDRKNSEKYMLDIEPKVKFGIELSALNTRIACMDTSDSIASSLWTLAKINNLGFNINYKSLPLFEKLNELELDEQSRDYYSLYFGGDYELLFTFSEDNLQSIMEISRKLKEPVTVIGNVVRGKNVTLIKDSKRAVLDDKSFRHFG